MWVLILVVTVKSTVIFTTSTSVATGSSIYSSLEACTNAKDAVTKAVMATDTGWFVTTRGVSAVCVPQ